MNFEQLSLRNFRNIEEAKLVTQGAACVVLQGANAQGKTNVLEAMYMVATGRSFRLAPARHMLRHESLTGALKATIVRAEVRHEVRVALHPNGRTIEVDGRNLRQVTQLLDMVNMVAFFPDDLRIAKGSPEERRRFMDRATANNQPPFVEAALAYHKALRSRNALLKDGRGADRAMVQVYDSQLVRFGSQMHLARLAWLREVLPVAREHFFAFMPQTSELAVMLQSGMWEGEGATDLSAIAEVYTEALQRSYGRDRARGMTCLGPHRADLVSLIDGSDARQFASQGQQRSLVLALKLAEVVCLTRRLGAPPILLLDDVSSELDAQRTRRLFEVIEACRSQVWVSTTGAVKLPISRDASWFTVEEGRLTQTSGAVRQLTAS